MTNKLIQDYFNSCFAVGQIGDCLLRNQRAKYRLLHACNELDFPYGVRWIENEDWDKLIDITFTSVSLNICNKKTLLFELAE